jgi:hypothetical protein
MAHPFKYHAPDSAQAATMEDLAEEYAEVYEQILASAASSAERTLAIRRLQESRMWANVAILGITIA